MNKLFFAKNAKKLNTKIFKNYEEFSERKNKKINGASYENKLAHFAHIISESSTSMDPDIADIVHKHLWESI